MHTLTDAAKIFALLDDVSDEKLPSLDKALRNYATRFYLPHDDQRGRVFLYDEASVFALRMIYLANECGMDRWLCEAFARWLRSSGDKRVKVEGGWHGVSISREAIQRVEHKEQFDFHVILERYQGDLRARFRADWQEEKLARVRNALSQGPQPVELGRFTLPASREIQGLLVCTRSGE